MAKAPSVSVADTFSRAMTLWEQGNGAEARRLARQIIDVQPNFGGAHYLLGIIALAQGPVRKAAEYLSRAVAADPAQPVPRMALGRALEAQDSLNAAILQYRAVVAMDAGHAEAHARLADLLGRAGKADEAILHGRRALAADPYHAEALAGLGVLLHQKGEDAEAASLLERALAVRPDWSTALHNYGLVLRRLGRTEQAVEILSGAVELRRDHAASRANLAGALRESGRLDEARLQAERATKLDSRDAGGWMELGLIRDRLGIPEGAAAAFERAVALLPHSAEAHWCLAEASRKLGETERAAVHYRACLDLDPEDHHGAALGLALLGMAPVPERAPDAYVRQLFDDYAGTFDTALVERLGYRAPALLAEALDTVLERKSGLVVLDAGCGTGLAAPVLRPLAERLDGVDLSPAMVEKARARGLYDSLEVNELGAALAARPGTYDLIAAADVLVYFGDLTPVMAAAAAALRPGGIFAFTLERAEDCDSYVLGPKSRYAHARGHVTSTAAAAGFTVLLLEAAVSRRDGGDEVPGLVAVLRKGLAAGTFGG